MPQRPTTNGEPLARDENPATPHHVLPRRGDEVHHAPRHDALLGARPPTRGVAGRVLRRDSRRIRRSRIAAPLAVGTTSDGELMDVFMAEAIPPRRRHRRSRVAAPGRRGSSRSRGSRHDAARPCRRMSVSRSTRWTSRPRSRNECEGDVDRTEDGGWTIEDGGTPDAGPSFYRPPSIVARITPLGQRSVAFAQFLAQSTIPWEHKREDEVRTYDIRAQVESIDVLAEGPASRVCACC